MVRFWGVLRGAGAPSLASEVDNWRYSRASIIQPSIICITSIIRLGNFLFRKRACPKCTCALQLLLWRQAYTYLLRMRR